MPASVDVLREQSRCKGRDRGPKRERGNPAAAGAVRSGLRSAAFPPQQYIPDELAETEEKTDGIAEYLENICSQHVVLWKEEGVVRAFMTWKDHFNCENLEAYPDSCYLTTLCVWPDYRGQGISEVMYAEAEKDIAAKFPGSRITLRTWSTNGAQEHILDKLGYSLVRRLKDDRGEGIDTVYFVKKEENEKNDR